MIADHKTHSERKEKEENEQYMTHDCLCSPYTDVTQSVLTAVHSFCGAAFIGGMCGGFVNDYIQKTAVMQ